MPNPIIEGAKITLKKYKLKVVSNNTRDKMYLISIVTGNEYLCYDFNEKYFIGKSHRAIPLEAMTCFLLIATYLKVEY